MTKTYNLDRVIEIAAEMVLCASVEESLINNNEAFKHYKPQ